MEDKQIHLQVISMDVQHHVACLHAFLEVGNQSMCDMGLGFYEYRIIQMCNSAPHLDADAQADRGLRCLYMPVDTFWLFAAQLVFVLKCINCMC